MTTGNNPTLRKLNDSGQTVERPENDVRGRHVRDKNGETIGKVEDLLVDDAQHKVRFLIVEHGGFLGFGESRSFIPVDAITRITDSDVYIDRQRDHVAAAPTYDPDLINDRPYHARVYGHYGFIPYWRASYEYPTAMTVPLEPPEDWPEALHRGPHETHET